MFTQAYDLHCHGCGRNNTIHVVFGMSVLQEAMKWDLEKTLEMGFNMVRKHIKIGKFPDICFVLELVNLH